ncbi:MAG: DUF2339 domain-containing protein [Rhodothermales bacterium]
MSQSDDPTLHDRLATLEATVAQLQNQLDRLHSQVQDNRKTTSAAPHEAPPQKARPEASKAALPRSPGAPSTARPALRPARRAPRSSTKSVRSVMKSEDWLNKIGIALLLFGLAFLFKFGMDKGWLTPRVRIGFGLALGVFLLVVGLRLRPKRLRLGQVLLGGGIATFYVTLFSAFQLYSLISYPVAFAAMALVSLLGFVLAVHQEDAALGVIAILGGLGTPFLLYTGEGNVPGLVAYTCAVLAATGGIYMFRGWRSLLFTSVVGGWLVFFIGWIEVAFGGSDTLTERGAFQAGVLFCLVIFGVLPVVREIWQHRRPEEWAMPALKVFKGVGFVERPAMVLVVAAPLVTLGLSRELWSFSDIGWGSIVAGAAGLYAAAYVLMRRGDLRRLGQAHGVAAAVLLAICWFDFFDDAGVRLLALAIEAAALHVLARVFSDRVLRFLGHSVFVIVALWLSQRLVNLDGNLPALLNGQALGDLLVLALGLGVTWTFRGPQTTILYRIVAYIGLLGWFWRELVDLPDGQAYVSIAWGLSAIALLVMGWMRDRDWVRNAGLVTLMVVVGKLFVVDLAKLEAVWRILLFLGFGGLLLLLSYFFPRLWKPTTDDEEELVS